MAYSAFCITFRKPVNPYVTGSSPVARARISAAFRGFFISHRCLHDINFDVFLHCRKWRKPAHYWYIFGVKLHIYTRDFPVVNHFTTFQTHGLAVRVSQKTYIRTSYNLQKSDTPCPCVRPISHYSTRHTDKFSPYVAAHNRF